MGVIIIEVDFSHKSPYLNKTQSFIGREAFREPNSTMGELYSSAKSVNSRSFIWRGEGKNPPLFYAF